VRVEHIARVAVHIARVLVELPAVVLLPLAVLQAVPLLPVAELVVRRVLRCHQSVFRTAYKILHPQPGCRNLNKT